MVTTRRERGGTAGSGRLFERPQRLQRHPLIAHLDVGPFYGRPCDAMGDLLLPRVSCMGSERMVEGRAIDILRVRRQMAADRGGQFGIPLIGHGAASGT